MRNKKFRIIVSLLAASLLLLLSACGGGSEVVTETNANGEVVTKVVDAGKAASYDDYKIAYQKTMANSSFDADMELTLKMDGNTKTATGNFKIDSSEADKDVFVLTVTTSDDSSDNESTVTQFSDGEYLYIDAQGRQMKSKVGEEVVRTQEDTQEQPSAPDGPSEGEAPTGPNGETPPEGGGDGQTPPEAPSAPEFNSEYFLADFASFLEAGKLQEMGLFDPLPSAVVTKTTKSGNVYTLEVSNEVVTTFLNQISEKIVSQAEGKVEVKDLQNFTYTATIENDVVTAVSYSGSMTVDVSGEITSDGEAASYTMDLVINLKFNNPGEKASITLPSTDGYKEYGKD